MAENGRNGTSHPGQPTMRHHVAIDDPGPPDRELLRTLALDPRSLPKERFQQAIRGVALRNDWNSAYQEELTGIISDPHSAPILDRPDNPGDGIEDGDGESSGEDELLWELLAELAADHDRMTCESDLSSRSRSGLSVPQIKG